MKACHPSEGRKGRRVSQLTEMDSSRASGDGKRLTQLCLLLSGLENVSVGDELGLDLSDNSGGDEDELEDREEPVLQICVRVADHPKGEPVKKRRTNVEGELGGDVSERGKEGGKEESQHGESRSRFHEGTHSVFLQSCVVARLMTSRS